MRRSADNGATWSNLSVVMDAAGDTIGNPTAVVDSITGKIWLFASWNAAATTYSGCTTNGCRKVYSSYSSDHGVTWSPKVLMTGLLPPTFSWDAVGPGSGIQLASGRLVIPAKGRRIGGIEAVLRVRAGAEGPRRAADGGRPSTAPGQCRGRAAPFGYTPAQAALPSGARPWAWACGQLPPGAQHHASCAGPCAEALFARRVARSMCSKIARTPPGAVSYAISWRLPPQLAQANTSSANVLPSSPAQSNRGVRSFFGSSTVTAIDGRSSSGSGSAPAWGRRITRCCDSSTRHTRSTRAAPTCTCSRCTASSPVRPSSG